MGKSKAVTAEALFNAPEIQTAPKPKKGKNGDRLVIPFIDFDLVAALGIVEKAIKSVSTQMKDAIKELATDEFVQQILATGTKPDSFTARGDNATGLVSLRKRGSNTKLDEETALKLIEKGIHVDEIEAVPERLVINAEILKDQKIIGAVAEAIQKHPKLKGVTVVMKQTAEKHYAVSEQTLPQLAQAAEKEGELREVLGKLAVISVGRFVLENCKDSGEQKKKALKILFDAEIL